MAGNGTGHQLLAWGNETTTTTTTTSSSSLLSSPTTDHHHHHIHPHIHYSRSTRFMMHTNPPSIRTGGVGPNHHGDSTGFPELGRLSLPFFPTGSTCPVAVLLIPRLAL
ncbi:uncharacterized protein BO80DRAFT_420622 [Aspergillus ibericus CBS 121593]|uniref:Uncharacterized protein n=1 Tax=Aspergillus ibericus CBS 121593 TaxID=1448316 RepID=A0A395HFQ5_9EURO|nr:hypothetical protein BO80DRAFT_420622 [Aspergillus ibericus CBS 121593]RAL06329.1 hypothetical protein BO80DRAFT_420622 [Aspergillus ibericus CBS 121593]